ncbi:MAG TPA: hypothetical protein VGL71_06180, partial [Urbifossiella sp.]
LGKKLEPTAIIASANYEGRVYGGLARFTARLIVQGFRDGETAIELPLADARLERVAVNGKPALPIAVRPDVYSVTVAGRGRHEIDVLFAAPIASTGPEREVHFGIPELPDSRLIFLAPASARQLQTLGRLGEQKIGNEKAAVRLEAGLGSIRTVQLRWREGAGGAAAIAVREGCVWDVAEPGHSLTACYLVRVSAGSATALQFDLPADLEPIRVGLRSLDVILGQNVLRDWSIGKETAGVRPLRLDFTGPTDGRLLATLECVPRGVPTRQPVLRFPKPVGMTRTDAIYGLRSSGVTIESIGRTGVIDFAADALLRDFGAIPDLRLSPSVPVVAFSPRPGESAELRPVLRSVHELPVISKEATWNMGLPQAEGSGIVKWSAKEPVPMLEFALPAAVAEVRGPDVAAWSQTAGRVQVWFRKPIKTGAVEWIASASTGKPFSPFAFDPPMPAVANARIASQVVRVRPAEGWGVRVDRDKGWKPLAAKDRSGIFQSEGNLPPPHWQFFPPVPGAANGFDLIEVTGSEVIDRSAVEMAIAPNRPHHLVLRAAGLPSGANAALEAPPGTIIHEEAKTDGMREWSLDVPGGPATMFRATLTIRFVAKGTIALPAMDFRVGGSPLHSKSVVHWIGVTGTKAGLRFEDA